MKKVFLFTILSICYFACKNQTEISTKEFINPYDHIGVKHNEGLEQVKFDLNQYLIDNKGVNDWGKIQKIITSSVENTSNLKSGFLFKSNIPIIHPNSNLRIAGVTVVSDIKDTIDGHEYSNIEIYFLNKIDSIFENLQDNLGANVYELEKVEIEVSEKCTDEEQKFLLQTISVSKYTLVYWAYNLRDWYNLHEEIIDHGSNSRSVISPNLPRAELNETYLSDLSLGVGDGDADWFRGTIGDMAEADAFGAMWGIVVGNPAAVAMGASGLTGARSLYHLWTN